MQFIVILDFIKYSVAAGKKASRLTGSEIQDLLAEHLCSAKASPSPGHTPRGAQGQPPGPL